MNALVYLFRSYLCSRQEICNNKHTEYYESIIRLIHTT